MLALEVRFLTGRYVATAYNDRSRAEWPPHPARLFSALAATHFAEVPPRSGEREALTWLEGLGAPEIEATDASERDLCTVFVPVNDLTVIGDFEDDVAELERLRAEAPADPKKATKHAQAVERAEERLRERFKKATQLGKKVAQEDLKKADAALPESHVKQPRTFPSVTPEEPRVVFFWRDAEATPEMIRLLDALAARVVRLGHSSSLVSMRVRDAAATPTWVPTEQGRLRLRVPAPDQLRRLEEAFALHEETQPRVMPSASQPYARVEAMARPGEAPARSEFSSDWIVLQRAKGSLSPPITAAPAIARALRGALMKHAEQPPLEILSGHRADGPASEQTHLAIVPLPFVGSEHADGSIAGVALVLPRDVSDDDRRHVFRAVARWEAHVRAESKEHADAETPPLRLLLGRAGELDLVRLEDRPELRTLRAETWCSRAKRWLSATPVALDKNPGELQHDDPLKARAAFEQAEAIVRAACARIGLLDPIGVTVQLASPLAGGVKAKKWGPFPPDRARTQRVLVHAAIQFEREVEGPILLGAGRYLGLGLFRPVNDHD